VVRPERRIVMNDKSAISCPVHVELDRIGSASECRPERGNRVFRVLSLRPAMSDAFHAVDGLSVFGALVYCRHPTTAGLAEIAEPRAQNDLNGYPPVTSTFWTE
jgi:hypothetical protein